MSAVARVGINGFGRIGRLVCRSAFTSNASKTQVMQINDPFMDIDYLIYLLKHDSVHGRFEHEVTKVEGGIKVGDHFVAVTNELKPENITWGKNGADFICESTGVFLSKDTASAHIAGGAKKVVLSAPPKDDSPIFVMGVNNDLYKSDMNVVSNASCTTNCLAPIAKVLHDNWGI